MSWFSKHVVRPTINVLRSPDRILNKAFKGDIKGALSVAVSPTAGTQATRDRVLRRTAGAAVGAAGGFITGGPAGAIAGGITGGLRASKGHGQIKDAAGSFVLSLGTGAIAGGAAGALGKPAWGGWAGKLGASWAAPKSPFDPVTGEFTEKYLSSTGGGGSSFWGSAVKTAGAVNSVASGLGPAMSALKPAQPYEEAPMAFPFDSYAPQEDHPISSQYVPQNAGAARGSSSGSLLLLGLGALIFLGVVNGKL